MKLKLSWQIFKKSTHITLHEICPVGVELLHGDRHYKSPAAFWYFTKVPKIPHLMPPLPTSSQCTRSNKISKKFFSTSKILDLTRIIGHINHLTPNYMVCTAQLTSRCCILYIYSTNIRTEYFKHAAQSPFFFSSKCRLFHNTTLFGSCIIHILNTGSAKI